jgi:hypothetical protein
MTNPTPYRLITSVELLPLLSACPLADLTRIDVGLEGDWSPTVTTVWTREGGRLSLTDVARVHESFKPSLELYFVDAWIGLHCFRRVGNTNVFDEDFLEKVVNDVESAIASST